MNIGHSLGYKTNIDTFKRISVIQNMFFDDNGIKLEINNRMIMRKSPNIWKVNNTFTNNAQVNVAKKEKYRNE